MLKTEVLEISQSLAAPLTAILGSRKTAVLEISEPLVVRLAEDLTAAVATSDQMLWSYRA
jgi:hypothetical protein